MDADSLATIVKLGSEYGLLLGGLAFLVGYSMSVVIDFFRSI